MKLVHRSKCYLLVFLLFINCLALSAQKKSFSAFRDSLDNKIDLSDWLVNKKGVLLMPTVITEPAVGYGGALSALYFHSSYSAKKGPPSISGVLGALTQNGTWAGGVFHAGFWKNDHIRYLGAFARTYVNLGFYGSGNIGLADMESVNLNMDAWLLIQRIKFRLGETNLFLGGQYLLFDTYNTFEVPVDMPDFSGSEFSSTLSEVSLKLELDSRNFVFSPTMGLFFGLTTTFSDTWIGGDALYGRVGLTLIGYIPAGDKVFVGLRHESNYSLGSVPFYARPIVSLRGAPLMKYQNSNTTLLEAEVDWNFYKRWSVLGFTGLGNAFENFTDFSKGKGVTTIGTGFRYLLARKLHMNMGMDFAKSNDDFAFYVVLGTAWMK